MEQEQEEEKIRQKYTKMMNDEIRDLKNGHRHPYRKSKQLRVLEFNCGFGLLDDLKKMELQSYDINDLTGVINIYIPNVLDEIQQMIDKKTRNKGNGPSPSLISIEEHEQRIQNVLLCQQFLIHFIEHNM